MLMNCNSSLYKTKLAEARVCLEVDDGDAPENLLLDEGEVWEDFSLRERWAAHRFGVAPPMDMVTPGRLQAKVCVA
jgi:hypothetical protein